MLGPRVFIALLSSLTAISTVNAYTGRASVESLGTAPCPIACPVSDFRAALPMDMFPNGEQCCSTVHLSYQGINIDAIFNDLFEAGNGSYNISLSREAFSQFAPLEVEEIYPVVWNL